MHSELYAASLYTRHRQCRGHVAATIQYCNKHFVFRAPPCQISKSGIRAIISPLSYVCILDILDILGTLDINERKHASGGFTSEKAHHARYFPGGKKRTHTATPNFSRLFPRSTWIARRTPQFTEGLVSSCSPNLVFIDYVLHALSSSSILYNIADGSPHETARKHNIWASTTHSLGYRHVREWKLPTTRTCCSCTTFDWRRGEKK